jgi:hypothetical protein
MFKLGQIVEVGIRLDQIAHCMKSDQVLDATAAAVGVGYQVISF